MKPDKTTRLLQSCTELIQLRALDSAETRTDHFLHQLHNTLKTALANPEPERASYYRGVKDGLAQQAARSNILDKPSTKSEMEMTLTKLGANGLESKVRRFAPTARTIGASGKKLTDKTITELKTDWEDLSDVFD